MTSNDQRNAWLARIAPILLTAVALTQWLHVREERLTPWKGGGFGMFSTVDSRGARFVRCFLARRQGGELHALQIEVPGAWGEHLDQLAYMPTEERASELARLLATGDWVERPPAAVGQLAVDSSVSLVPPAAWVRGLAGGDRYGPGIPIDFDLVIVQAWTSSYDDASNQMTARKLVQVTAPRAPAAGEANHVQSGS